MCAAKSLESEPNHHYVFAPTLEAIEFLDVFLFFGVPRESCSSWLLNYAGYVLAMAMAAILTWLFVVFVSSSSFEL